MDQQDIQNDNADSVWPEISADVTLARGAARSITLDTQRASTDGRIIEMTGHLELMRERLSSLEEHIFDVETSGSTSQDFTEQFAALDREIEATASQFQSLALRVSAAEESVATTMMVSVDGFDSRLALVEDARLSQSNELNELTSYLEQAFTRIAELAEVIEEERTSNSTARDHFAEQSSALTTTIEARVSELQGSINELNNQLHLATSSIDSSAGDMHDALVASVGELERRVAATETQVTAIDEISSSIRFLSARADALDAQQKQTSDDHVSRTELTDLAGRVDTQTNEIHARATESDERQSELGGHVERAHARIDETQQEIGELRTQLATPSEEATSPALAAELHELRSTVTSAVDAQDVNRVAMSRNREDINAQGTAIERAEADRIETRQLVQDVSDRIGNVAENAELIGQRVDLVQGTSDDLHERVEELRSTSASLASHVEHVDENVHDLSGRLENTATALDATHQRLDDAAAIAQSAHARIDQTTHELSSRIEESAHAVDERLYETNQDLDARFGQTVDHVNAKLGETVDHVNQRLDETVNHVNQRLDESVDHRLDAVDQRVETIDQRTGESINTIDQRVETIDQRTGESINTIDQRVETIDQRTRESINTIDQRVEAIDQRVEGHAEDVNQRLSSIDDDLGNVGGRIENLETDSANATVRAEEMAAKIDKTIVCVEGAVGAAADITHRVASTEQHAASVDNHLAAVQEHVVTVQENVATVQEHVVTVQENVATVQEHVATVQENVATVQEHVASVKHQVASTDQQIASSAQHLAALDDRTTDLDNRTTQIDNRTTQIDNRTTEIETAGGQTQQTVSSLEQRVSEAEHLLSTSDERFVVTEQHLAAQDDRLSSTEQTLSDHDARFEHVEDRISQTHAHIEERATATRDHLLRRVDEARAQLQHTLDESNAKASESQSDLRTSVFDRLEVVEETIESRFAGLENTMLDVDHEPQLQSLETSVAAVETRANEAYAFTESLRQLQTDIVQALQDELRSHESQLGGFDGRLAELEATGQEFASAERVHMLEAKLVEALQTISQLTQLQRRNTTVEAQLTDTLATTSHGVESTQSNVMQLREELTAAQQRIGHLEQRLSTHAAVQPATVASAPRSPGLEDRRPAGSIDEDDQALIGPDEDADTGWFTESYARKNEEPKAS